MSGAARQAIRSRAYAGGPGEGAEPRRILTVPQRHGLWVGSGSGSAPARYPACRYEPSSAARGHPAAVVERGCWRLAHAGGAGNGVVFRGRSPSRTAPANRINKVSGTKLCRGPRKAGANAQRPISASVAHAGSLDDRQERSTAPAASSSKQRAARRDHGGGPSSSPRWLAIWDARRRSSQTT